MSKVTMVLSSLVALEFFYILYLETFATTSKKTSQIFGMNQEELARKSVTTLFKNQGVYNGLLGGGLIYALLVNHSMIQPILVYIILVAAYGALTSDKKIIVTQGGLAILAFCSSFF